MHAYFTKLEGIVSSGLCSLLVQGVFLAFQAALGNSMLNWFKGSQLSTPKMQGDMISQFKAHLRDGAGERFRLNAASREESRFCWPRKYGLADVHQSAQ